MRLLWALLCGAAALLWLRPAGTSLWLDETVTYWMASNSLDTLLARGREFSGGNPFYYMFPWASLKLFGVSELALRLPSLLAMGVATLLVAAIARRLFDRETGVLAALVFALHQLIQFEARNARTYAIGVCFAAAATLALLRWLERPNWKRALVYGLLAGCVFATHFLFAGLVLVHGIIAVLWMAMRATPARIGALLLLGLFTAIGVAPTLGLFLSLHDRGDVLIVLGVPHVEDLTRVLAPTATLTAAMCALVLLGLFGKLRRDGNAPTLPRATLVASAALFFLPPIAVFLISRFTPTHIFIPRYFAYHVIGGALLGGWAWRQIESARARTIVACVLVLLACGAYTTRRHHNNEWKGIAIAVNEALAKMPGAPVLANTGLIEAKDTAWLSDPHRAAYLLAPFSFYPLLNGHELRALPWSAHSDMAQTYLDEQARWLDANHDSFVLVSRDSSEPGFWPWFRGRMRPLGWKDHRLEGTFGNLIAVTFERQR